MDKAGDLNTKGKPSEIWKRSGIATECYIGPGISSKFWAFRALGFSIEPASMNRGQLYETHSKVTWTTHKTKLIEGLMKERSAVADGIGQRCTWLLARDQEKHLHESGVLLTTLCTGVLVAKAHIKLQLTVSATLPTSNCESRFMSPHWSHALTNHTGQVGLALLIGQVEIMWLFSCGYRGTTGGDPERTVKRLSLLMLYALFSGMCLFRPASSITLPLSTEFMIALLPFPGPIPF